MTMIRKRNYKQRILGVTAKVAEETIVVDIVHKAVWADHKRLCTTANEITGKELYNNFNSGEEKGIIRYNVNTFDQLQQLIKSISDAFMVKTMHLHSEAELIEEIYGSATF